jgi:hypothetical protein
LFKWTPSEDQGPGSYTLTVRVTDEGIAPLTSTGTLVIKVREINRPPVLAAIENKTIPEGTQLTINCSVSDPDLPPQIVTFTLDPSAPSGAVIDPATGVFSWTPTEAQGPETNTITVRVTDNGSPALGDGRNFTVTISIPTGRLGDKSPSEQIEHHLVYSARPKYLSSSRISRRKLDRLNITAQQKAARQFKKSIPLRTVLGSSNCTCFDPNQDSTIWRRRSSASGSSLEPNFRH